MKKSILQKDFFKTHFLADSGYPIHHNEVNVNGLFALGFQKISKEYTYYLTYT